MKQFILKYWAAFGGVPALVIILYILLISDTGLSGIRTIAALNLAFLMLHQFEEYIFPGGFKEFFNINIAGKSRIIPFPVSDKGIIIVNIVLGWGFYSAGIIKPIPVFILILLGASLLNGIVHTAVMIRLRKYNPGFITGMFIFIPFTLYAGKLIIRSGSITPPEWLLIIPLTIAGSALIPVTLYLCRKRNV